MQEIAPFLRVAAPAEGVMNSSFRIVVGHSLDNLWSSLSEYGHDCQIAVRLGIRSDLYEKT